MRIFQSKLDKLYEIVNKDASKLKSMTDDEIDHYLIKTVDTSNVSNQKALEASFLKILSIARDMARRSIKDNLFAYKEQIIASIHLFRGTIIEMANGEGKTLVAALSTSVGSLLSGKQVHITTYNQYLAKRDLLWMGPFYIRMGLTPVVLLDKTVGYLEQINDIPSDLVSNDDDSSIYYEKEYISIQNKLYQYSETLMNEREGLEILQQANIVYGTINSIILRYLFDNRSYSFDDIAFKDSFFWIIMDEADYTLIDNARQDIQVVYHSLTDRWNIEDIKLLYEIVSQFDKQDYNLANNHLTKKGKQRVAEILGYESIYELDFEKIIIVNEIICGLYGLTRDVDYIVENNRIYPVDKITGRKKISSSYDWLTQLTLLIKEELNIDEYLEHDNFIQRQVTAKISIQNYVKLYERISGMSGTSHIFKKEFKAFYNVDTVQINPHFPCIRIEHNDLIYMTKTVKLLFIIEKIILYNSLGRPVLVDCPDILSAELLFQALTTKKITDFKSSINYAKKVFGESNEKHFDTEDIGSKINSLFRDLGNISPSLLTAKNDSLEASIIKKAGKSGAVTITAKMAGRGTDIIIDEEAKKKGGLLVIGYDRNESRHIDEQIKGRVARQGNPGESLFFLSLKDDLLRIFGGKRIENVFSTLGMEYEEIQHNLISKAIMSAQKKITKHHFESRLLLFKLDSLLDQHRKYIYGFRRRLLNPETPIISELQIIINNSIERTFTKFLLSKKDWNIWFDYLKSFNIFSNTEILSYEIKEKTIKYHLQERLMNIITSTEQINEQNYDSFFSFRHILLQSIDSMWAQHLQSDERIQKKLYSASCKDFDRNTFIKIYQKDLYNDYQNKLIEFEENSIRRILSLCSKILEEIKWRE